VNRLLEPSLLGLVADTASCADNVAVIDDEFTLSYGDLEELVAAASQELARRGVERGTRVALGTERSAGQIVALLALLDLGAVACPVSLSGASGQRKRLLRRVEPKLTLSGREEWLFVRASSASRSTRERTATRTSDLAYIAPTSGSAGVPKAVAVPRSALQNRLEWAQSTYPLEADDVVLYASTLTFDFAFWEILAPLSTGGALAVLPNGAESEPEVTADTIARTGATVAHFVPFALAELLSNGLAERLSGLRLLLCGGERLSLELATSVLKILDARLFNQYGPTESCIDVLAGEITLGGLADGDVPIGRPIEGVVARVLDAEGCVIQDDSPGMLHVGGRCLAWGYLKEGSRTAESFVPDAWSEEPGARLYKTGDLVRRTPTGAFVYLGRRDDQVKVRGVRLELGDISAVLETHQDIVEAHVVTVPGDTWPELIAHFAPATRNPTDAELRAFIADELAPAAMPARFVRHGRLPRQPSGKIDRAALSRATVVPSESPSGLVDEPPAGPEEEEIAAIWSAVLKHPTIARNADFFALGGESLLAMRMTARVRRALGVPLPVRTVFDSPTLAAFAHAVSIARQASP
jgi:amino acid adenylation domain-containing protein